jgi:hypothetical protein
MRRGILIDRYAQASCIDARRAEPRSLPEWDQVIQGPGGCAARVVGAVKSTGFVSVEYPDNARLLVASFGEKSNPVDVRVDLGNCRLYVRSVGSPLFVDHAPIWLVEYDLRHRRELQSATVEPGALPSPCPASSGAG